MDLAVIDVVFFVIIAISALRCAVRGFVSELLSMAALISGLLLAIIFFRQGAVFVREQFMPDQKMIPEIISFVMIFLVVFAVVKMVEMVLKNIIEGIHLGGFDRLMGFVFGCAQGIVIVCLVLFVISIQPFFDPVIILGKSFCAEILLPLIMGSKKGLQEMIIRLDMPGEILNGV